MSALLLIALIVLADRWLQKHDGLLYTRAEIDAMRQKSLPAPLDDIR
jgi:hypothetical protein